MTWRVRAAGVADMPGMFGVRTSVRENRLDEDQLAELGITPDELVIRMMDRKLEAWCAEADGAIVGFSMVLPEDREVFALFVLPPWEGQGVGSALLELATARLFEHADRPVVLSTGSDSTARIHYQHRGWRVAGEKPERGDVIMTLDPPRCSLRPALGSDRETIVGLMERLAAFDRPSWRSAQEIAAADVHLLDSYLEGAAGTVVYVARLRATPGLAGVVIGKLRKDYFTERLNLHVEVLCVAAAAEGQGVGRALMDRIEAFGAAGGADTMTLTVFHRNQRARGVYERLGYEPEFVHYRKAVGRIRREST